MKKKIVAFGILSLFFAGICSAQSSDTWTPNFTEDTTAKTCRESEEGFWIPVSSSYGKGRCLKKDSCDDLNFNITTHKKDENNSPGIDVKVEGINYVVSKDDVTCKKKDCFLAGYDINVKCYTDSEHNTLAEIKEGEKDITPTDHCVIHPSKLRIKNIDTLGNPPEWYCPYSWDNSYPENKYPYKEDAPDRLKSLYGYSPDSDEIMRYCSARMFALSKSCGVTLGEKASSRSAIEGVKSDFLAKKAESIWRNEIFKAVSSPETKKIYWDIVKRLSFTSICNPNPDDDNKCNSNVYDEEKDTKKKNAIMKVQEWLSTQTKELRDSSTTPTKYVEEKAEKVWKGDKNKGIDPILFSKFKEILDYKDDNKALEAIEKISEGDFAKEKYAKARNTAQAEENSARLLSKYIQKRNMDLNIQVSIGQTKELNVSEILSMSENSNERKLRAFTQDDDKSINIFDKIIRLTVRVLGTLAILLLIISGVQMILSQGDENKLSEAKTVFTSTLIGLAIGFLSYTIVRFIIDTLLS